MAAAQDSAHRQSENHSLVIRSPGSGRANRTKARYLALVCAVLTALASSVILSQAVSAQPIDSSTGNSGDFATDAYGDAWDFDNAEDLAPAMRGLSVGISGLTMTPLSAGNSALTGTAAPASYLVLAGNAPHVLPWGHDTRLFPIDADRYTQLTLSMYSSGPMPAGAFYTLCVDGPGTCYNGSPFSISAGWRTYTLNLRTAPVYYPSNQRWSGSGSLFRLAFNPKAATNFQIDWIRLGTAGTTGLNASEPQPSVVSPSSSGGTDYATAVRGRPWNVQSPGDVGLVGMGDVTYSSSGLRGKNVITPSIPRGNDPHLQLPLPTPIDGSKYNHFSVDVCYDGKFGLADAPGGGMNGRVIWQIAGETFVRNSQDFVVFPGCQLIDLDLSQAPSVVEDETDVNKPGGLRGFAGNSIIGLRFDPHEDPGTRYFDVRSIRLTSSPVAAGGSQIQFADANWQPGTAADIWLDQAGNGTSLRQIARAVAVTAGRNTFSWLGRDISGAAVPNGRYYVKVRLANPSGAVAVYSSTQLVLGAGPAAPGAVGGVQTVAGKGSVNVAWNAPTSGGAPLSYLVSAGNGGSQTVAGTATTATFTGLSNGAGYQFSVAAQNGAGRSATSPQIAATPQAGAGSYVALPSPQRILDTRRTARLGAGSTITMQVSGAGAPAGLPTSGVSAIAVNLTAVNPSASGNITMWPSGMNRPQSSNLNFPAGVDVANMVVAKVGAGGRISIFNASGSVDVLVDVTGYYSDGSTGAPVGATYFPLTPSRILDTRSGVGAPAHALGAGSTVAVQATGVGGVPASGVSAVVLNLTGVGSTTGGFLSTWPAGSSRPGSSSLNMVPGDTRANLVTVTVGTGGKINLFNSAGSVHVLADVVGWFGTAGNLSGASLLPVSPYRIFDSRPPSATSYPTLPLIAGTSRVLELAGQGSGVPVGPVKAVVANVTTVGANSNGFVTMWPAGQSQPTASTINLRAGQARPNLVVERVPAAGTASVAVSAGNTALLVDVLAWYG